MLLEENRTQRERILGAVKQRREEQIKLMAMVRHRLAEQLRTGEEMLANRLRKLVSAMTERSWVGAQLSAYEHAAAEEIGNEGRRQMEAGVERMSGQLPLTAISDGEMDWAEGRLASEVHPLQMPGNMPPLRRDEPVSEGMRYALRGVGGAPAGMALRAGRPHSRGIAPGAMTGRFSQVQGQSLSASQPFHSRLREARTPRTPTTPKAPGWQANTLRRVRTPGPLVTTS